jgi:hypothetical protein
MFCSMCFETSGHLTFTIERPDLAQILRAKWPAAHTCGHNATARQVDARRAEAGVPGYELTAWAGIGAPAGTPRPVIDRLSGEIAKIVATAEARAWLESFGIDPGAEPLDAFAALVRAEYAQMGEVILAMGIRAE